MREQQQQQQQQRVVTIYICYRFCCARAPCVLETCVCACVRAFARCVIVFTRARAHTRGERTCMCASVRDSRSTSAMLNYLRFVFNDFIIFLVFVYAHYGYIRTTATTVVVHLFCIFLSYFLHVKQLLLTEWIIKRVILVILTKLINFSLKGSNHYHHRRRH